MVVDMNKHKWVRTVDQPPENNVIVETMDSTGRVSLLKRDGRLWWLSDGSMYVYYTPMMWRYTQ